MLLQYYDSDTAGGNVSGACAATRAGGGYLWSAFGYLRPKPSSGRSRCARPRCRN